MNRKKLPLLLFSLISLILFSIQSPVFLRSQEDSDSDSSPKAGEIVPEAQRMVLEVLVPTKQLKNPSVLRAIMSVPRAQFVPKDLRPFAYQDITLPIGESQTISPPFVVAYMTEKLDPKPTDRVLEIGTGSGYQAAVLSSLVKDVYTIEIVRSLGQRAESVLKKLDYTNVHCKVGDGYLGWPEAAPFDKIIVTCSPENIPKPLVEQLKEGGKILIPLGDRYQQYFYLMTKVKGEMQKETLIPAFFVPMTGEAESQREVKPDPKNPKIIGGDFEQINKETNTPAGWYYTRNVAVAQDMSAPSGQSVLLFNNEMIRKEQERKERLNEGGFAMSGTQKAHELIAHTLQSFAIDGIYVKKLDFSCYIRGTDLHSFDNRKTIHLVALSFFDKERAFIGEKVIVAVPTRDFTWNLFERKEIPVPKRAKEAAIRIGILNGTGEVAIDNIELKKSQK